MVAVELPSGTWLFLVTLTFGHSCLASDTGSSCTASLHKAVHGGDADTTTYPHIANPDEIAVGASFVQRNAARHTAGVSIYSTAERPSDFASATTNKTLNGFHDSLVQFDLMNEDILVGHILRSSSRHVSAVGGSATHRRHHRKAHSVFAPKSIGERVCMTMILAFTLVGLYLYSGRSNSWSPEALSNDVAQNSQAAEVLSSDVAQKPCTPPEPAPDVSSDSASRSARDVVEDLGFGHAQWRILLLANGVWFLDGWELALVNTVATSTALDMGLSAYGRAMLSSMAMLGLIPGCMLGGWLGDKIGRKPPIIMSYLTVAVVSWGTALAPDARSLLALRGCMGVACGLGMPSSTVIMSELAPARWRGAMIAGRGFLYTTGIVLAEVVVLSLDPTLEQLNWRFCFMMVIPPTLLLLIPTCLFLFESPMFFACIGEHHKAKLAFEHMRHLNACPEVSISYTDFHDSEPTANDGNRTGTFWDHLRVIFSYGMLACSLTLMFTCATASLFASGHAYGLPRVLIEEAEKHFLSPGVQIVIECAWGYFGCLLLFGIDCFLNRKRMLTTFYTLFVILFSIFAWTAANDQHNWKAAVALQVSLAFIRIILKVMLLTVHIASTECYPTALLSTGTAIVLGIGRVGSAMSPFVFEWFHVTAGTVVAFYYACAAIACLNGVIILAFLPESLEAARTISSKHLSFILSGNMVRKAKAFSG